MHGECWEQFLARAEGEGVWAATRYTKPQRLSAVPTTTRPGRTVGTRSGGGRVLMDISFLSPMPHEGDGGAEGHPASLPGGL